MPAHFCGVYAHKPTFGLLPSRGYDRPPNLPLPVSGDLAVMGPMARTAPDLALALDAIAGPDEASDGVGYRLMLPPARHRQLGEFRVLVIDGHPLMPTDGAVRSAIDGLARQLAKAGVSAARPRGFCADLHAAFRSRQKCGRETRNL